MASDATERVPRPRGRRVPARSRRADQGGTRDRERRPGGAEHVRRADRRRPRRRPPGRGATPASRAPQQAAWHDHHRA